MSIDLDSVLLLGKIGMIVVEALIDILALIG